MAKHKSAKELMAERNPLNRVAVAPVDIYSQKPEPPTVLTPQPKATPTVKRASKPQDTTDVIRPYSTYLRQSQVKGIKLRAVEGDVKDQHIVQAAVDEYFKNHPL